MSGTFFCDTCGVQPIVNVRFRCSGPCIDYDECGACHAAATHDPSHVFEEIAVEKRPDEVRQFVNRLAKEVGEFFSHTGEHPNVVSGMRVEDDFSSHISPFVAYTLMHTYGSKDDMEARVAKSVADFVTLKTLYPDGTHRGVCNNSKGDGRLGVCQRCTIELEMTIMATAVSFFPIGGENLAKLMFASEDAQTGRAVKWTEIHKHWYSLSAADQAVFAAREKALFAHLDTLQWPLQL